MDERTREELKAYYDANPLPPEPTYSVDDTEVGGSIQEYIRPV